MKLYDNNGNLKFAAGTVVEDGRFKIGIRNEEKNALLCFELSTDDVLKLAKEVSFYITNQMLNALCDRIEKEGKDE